MDTAMKAVCPPTQHQPRLFCIPRAMLGLAAMAQHHGSAPCNQGDACTAFVITDQGPWTLRSQNRLRNQGTGSGTRELQPSSSPSPALGVRPGSAGCAALTAR